MLEREGVRIGGERAREVGGVQQGYDGQKEGALLSNIISFLSYLFLPSKLFTLVASQSFTPDTKRHTQTHRHTYTVQSCHSSKLGQWQRYTGVTSKAPIVSITLVQHWHLFSI